MVKNDCEKRKASIQDLFIAQGQAIQYIIYYPSSAEETWI